MNTLNPEKNAMATILAGTRFGDLSYEETDVIEFSDGLIGFPTSRRFLVLNPNPESPFRWLQSVDQPELAFLVVDPVHYVASYQPSIPAHQAERIQLQESTPRLLFVTVSIPKGDPKGMSLNLAGPVVINAETRQARQFVLEDEAYTTKHRVFQDDASNDRPQAA